MISSAIPRLRTTHLAEFYAGIRAGDARFHLKLVDTEDPSTDDARAMAEALTRRGVRLVKDVHDTPWGTREFAITDDQGHTLYLGRRLA